MFVHTLSGMTTIKSFPKTKSAPSKAEKPAPKKVAAPEPKKAAPVVKKARRSNAEIAKARTEKLVKQLTRDVARYSRVATYLGKWTSDASAVAASKNVQTVFGLLKETMSEIGKIDVNAPRGSKKTPAIKDPKVDMIGKLGKRDQKRFRFEHGENDRVALGGFKVLAVEGKMTRLVSVVDPAVTFVAESHLRAV